MDKQLYCSRKCANEELLTGKKRFFSDDWIKNIRNSIIKKQGVGEKHFNWKGEKVSYQGLHDWVRRWRGTPCKCEHCGVKKISFNRFHWANKSGNYYRDLSDWIRLCAKCHKRYDLNKIK